MVIDPITGQKMRSWRGMIQPQNLLEDLLQFMDGSPSDLHVSHSHKRSRESSKSPIPRPQPTTAADNNNENDEELQRALAMSMDDKKEIDTKSDHTKKVDDATAEPQVKRPTYLPLPEEPKGDRNLLCMVGVRLPDGRRIRRNFLRTDPVQLLWSFCSLELKEDSNRPFRLSQAIPGASKTLDFNVISTFEESKLANSMISVTWE